MKQRLLLLILSLLAMANLEATNYYYAKVTASDGTVTWLPIEWEWNSQYSRYSKFRADWMQSDIKGELDLDEVWTEYGGKGNKVTLSEIGSGCFFSFSGLTSVKGTSVRTLKNQAFQYCSSLTNVYFPNLEKMEDYALADCSSLVAFSIPASAFSIDGRAFSNCTSLTRLSVEAGNYSFSVESNILYNKNKTALYAFLSCRNDTAFVVPSTIKTIGEGAFAGRNKLKSVVVPNGVETIGDQAFSNSSIQFLYIPKSVTSIGTWAFSRANVKVANPEPITLKTSIFSSSATLIVPKGSKAAYENAAYWKEASEILEFSPSPVITFADATVKDICVSNWDYNGDGELDTDEAKEIRDLGTRFKDNTEIVSFDELQYFTSLTSISASAFSGCTSLASFKMPPSVSYIGSNAFLNTAWLNSQPDGLVYIGNILYAYKGSLPQDTKIVVKDGTTCVCDYVFNNCSGLTGIDLPASLKHIGEYAFAGCRGLSTITIPAGIKEIARYAFNESGVKTVELPEGLESVGNSAFRSCTSLESLVIPDKVKTIGKNSFRGCTRLQSVTMPSYLQSVATDAFRDCSSLKRVGISNLSGWCNIDFEDSRANPLYYAHHLYLNGEEVVSLETSAYYEWPYYSVFRNDWILSSYSWETIKPYVFYGCEGLKTVSITKNITSVGNYALAGCTSLSTVKVESYFELPFYAFPTRENVSLYVPKGYASVFNIANAWNTFKTIKEYPDADVNTDGEIDIVDVVDIVRHSVGTPSTSFDKILADLNSDKAVDLNDAKQEINIVAYSTTLSALSPSDGEPANRIRLGNFEVRARKSCAASIVLENESDNLVGFQIDMTLPDGIRLNTNLCRLGNRWADEEQQLTIREIGNNTYRLTSASLSLQPVTGNEGELITLSFDATNLAASGNITLGNIRLASSDSERFVLANDELTVNPVEYLQFSEGEGTEENPYLLYDANDFVNLASDVNGGTSYKGVFFKVASPEIYFGGVSYSAIGTESAQFAGHFDGNNAVIKNLSTSTGLFGYLSKSGSVTGVTVDETCKVEGTMDIAGIVRVNRGTISNCTNKADVFSTHYRVGGICGDNMGTITHCHNFGNVSSTNGDTSTLGGIAGDVDGGNILNCNNYGTINGRRAWVGGIVGLVCGSNSSVSGCTNSGNVTGYSSVGGIFGHSSDSKAAISNNRVTNCTIASSSPGAGAISATSYGIFTNNYYTTDVVVIVGDKTYEGTTPRGVWRSNGPEDVTDNDGAVLLKSYDVNGDSIINMADVATILSVIAGSQNHSAAEATRADVNGDGKADIGDVLTLLNFLGSQK